MRRYPIALVLTSANRSDDPICFTEDDAVHRLLPPLCDAVLDHDRPIHVPCDDSVVRVVDDRELPIRRSRGYAPLPVDLGRDGPPVLAVGGELKNTFCLTDGARAYLSGHIGDMETLETLRAFERAVGQLSEIRHQPVRLAADLHPGISHPQLGGAPCRRSTTGSDSAPPRARGVAAGRARTSR